MRRGGRNGWAFSLAERERWRGTPIRFSQVAGREMSRRDRIIWRREAHRGHGSEAGIPGRLTRTYTCRPLSSNLSTQSSNVPSPSPDYRRVTKISSPDRHNHRPLQVNVTENAPNLERHCNAVNTLPVLVSRQDLFFSISQEFQGEKRLDLPPGP